ncbi:MAG: tetratricopeptide repeat protein, partial [Candidatus Eremiobacteraeota bacterium]|nr:tetratricopeptide repeat protein [Candidatus Eremiobacteraeota bacterium]
FDQKYAASDTEFSRAIDVNPNYALAHEWYGTSLLGRGRMVDARMQLQTAVALEPIATATNAWLGTEAYYERRYGDAIMYLRRALDLNPSRFDSVLFLGLAQQQVGDYQSALKTFARLSALKEHRAYIKLLIAAVYERIGRRQQALAQARAARNSPDVMPEDVALAFVALGQRDEALHYMHHARFKSVVDRMWLSLDPRWDPVRRDPRFRPWIRAV